MKPQKSIYWMVTIVLSYLLVGSILAQVIGNTLGQFPFVQTIIVLAFGVGALWFAARHIGKKSLLPNNAIIKTIAGTELIFIVIGGGLLAYGTTLPTLSSSMISSGVFSLVLNVIVYGIALYFFLRKAAAQS